MLYIIDIVGLRALAGVGMKVYKDSAAGGFFVENITKGAPAEVAGVSKSPKTISLQQRRLCFFCTEWMLLAQWCGPRPRMPSVGV